MKFDPGNEKYVASPKQVTGEANNLPVQTIDNFGDGKEQSTKKTIAQKKKQNVENYGDLPPHHPQAVQAYILFTVIGKLFTVFSLL